jgi:hypothetical protein
VTAPAWPRQLAPQGKYKEESERFFFEKKKQKTFAKLGFWYQYCYNPQ